MSLVRTRKPFNWMNIFDDMEDFFVTREDRFSMPVDLIEKDDDYVIKATVPGIDKDQIVVNVNQADRYIDIKVEENGEKEEEVESEGVKYLHRERHFGTSSRRIKFGTPISPENASMELKDGILTITIPKAEEAKTVALSLN